MSFTNDYLNDVFDKTAGRCHICGARLAFSNFGRHGRRGAWERDHSRPRARGGSDGLNNLLPACTSCNRRKQDRSTRSARALHGRTRAPLSLAKEQRVRQERALRGGACGAALGALVGGWRGALLGTVAVALVGYHLPID